MAAHRNDRPRPASRTGTQRLSAHNGGAAMPARPRQHDDDRDTMTTPSPARTCTRGLFTSSPKVTLSSSSDAAVNSTAEEGNRAVHDHTVQRDVYQFVVERHPPGDLLHRRKGCRVGPSNVLHLRLPDDVPVLVGLTLVWAQALVRTRGKDLEVHVLAREVIASWQVCLKEQNRHVAVGEDDSANRNLDVSTAGESLNAFVRIARMAGHFLILFQPTVEEPWLPTGDEQVVQLVVVADPRDVRGQTALHYDVEPLRHRALGQEEGGAAGWLFRAWTQQT